MSDPGESLQNVKLTSFLVLGSIAGSMLALIYKRCYLTSGINNQSGCLLGHHRPQDRDSQNQADGDKRPLNRFPTHSQTFRIPSGTLQNQNGFVFSESSLQLTKLGDRVRWEATIICELK